LVWTDDRCVGIFDPEVELTRWSLHQKVD
jgi:hypothetical protein